MPIPIGTTAPTSFDQMTRPTETEPAPLPTSNTVTPEQAQDAKDAFDAAQGDYNKLADAILGWKGKGLNAAQLDYLRDYFGLQPTLRTAAEVEKDRRLASWRVAMSGARAGWPTWSGNWQGVPPPQGYTVSKDWLPEDLQPWLNARFWLTPFSAGQPNLRFSNFDWANIDPAYRGGVENWLRQRGFRPSGSLGQYSYNAWTNPNRGFQFNQGMLNAVPDENLRKWIEDMLRGKGWASW